MDETPSGYKALPSQQSRNARLLFSTAWLFLFIGLGFYADYAGVPAFDLAIRNTIHAHSSLAVAGIMLDASRLGSRQLLVPVIIILLIILAVLKDKPGLVFLGYVTIGEIVLETSTKDFFHRARPESFFHVPLPHSYSYPSGHSLGSICFYGALALVGSRYFAAAGKWIVYLSAVLIVGLVGFSRIYLGVHYPTDVIGGYFLGAWWLSLLSSLLNLQSAPIKRKGSEI
jgi:undecaprenyl-diphosphatase